MSKIKPCASCGKPLGFSYYISPEKPGRFHQECLPLPAPVQAEEAALAKAKLPGRKVTRKEAMAIAERVVIEAERRRDEATAEEAAHGDPPYPHELVARLREMAADYAEFLNWWHEDYEAKMKAIADKYWPKDADHDWTSNNYGDSDWMLGHLRAADLLAMLDPEAAKAAKDKPHPLANLKAAMEEHA